MNTLKNVGYPGIDMYPMQQVNINGTQPLGADHAVFYPVITTASTSSVAGTAPKNAIVEVFRTTNDPGLYGPGESFVGSTVADSVGNWSLTATLPAGAIVTATATALGNINTSEYGAERRGPRGGPGRPRRDVLELDGLLRHLDDEHPGRHGGGIVVAGLEHARALGSRRQPRHPPAGAPDGARDRQLHVLDRE